MSESINSEGKSGNDDEIVLDKFGDEVFSYLATVS